MTAPLTEENDKMNSHPAPGQPIDPYSRYSFNDLLTCIREQQAALIAAEDYVRSCANSPQFADALLATINKWRIE